MSLCPKCGREYCDHSMEVRGQTFREMMAPITEEEKHMDIIDRYRTSRDGSNK